ncbi:hypothetical protein Poli38472_000042 [Pythium oligandrum]|uniref:HSF-type DNA-binding domain-containing protein n=1 Tax=Pythium oligandrum TaxID=41045 RepID=A0A8K1FE05_PYTOL|nr:hypothetical protein Poli38472_000042 [Pythium oligandrum]|eukprot:TMW60000.1 hypothetical protein Poli38472_000042 [Pythium oligandrum]
MRMRSASYPEKMTLATPTATPFVVAMPAKKAVSATRVPKFLRCLYDILHNEDQSILSWSKDGTHFQIYNTKRLEVEVLPKYFKHGKFASFQRQLNNFGFRKWTKTQSNVCTFSHHHYVQRHPQQLVDLVIQHNETMAKSEAKGAAKQTQCVSHGKRKRSESESEACVVAKAIKKEVVSSPASGSFTNQRPASLPIANLSKIEESAFDFEVESWNVISDITPIVWATKPHVMIKTESGNETPTSVCGYADITFDFTIEEIDDILETTSSLADDPVLSSGRDAPVTTWEAELFKHELDVYTPDSDLWV